MFVPSRHRPLSIGFLLVDGFSLMAFTSAIEPLRVSNRLGGELFRWRLISADGKPVAASNGLEIVAEAAALPIELDCLLVCAGFDAERQASPQLDAWLRRCGRFGTALGALDTGAFLLARAGLLAGYRITLHWEAIPAFREAYPEVEVAPELFVVDRDRITCAGGTAALDLMLHLIAQLHGSRLATAVAEQFIYQVTRQNSESQRLRLSTRLGFTDPRLATALAAMEDHLAEPLGIPALAAQAGIGRRELERLFRTKLGTTPLAHYRALRLRYARSLLAQTDLSVREIGLACGFASLEHFSRSYHRLFGRPPRADRGLSMLPADW